MSRWIEAAGVLLLSVGLGYVLTRAGFADPAEVYAMFRFEDLRLVLAFGLAVALLVPAWPLIRRLQPVRWPSRRIHPGTIPGGVLFGVGWALCGACPSIAFVRLGGQEWTALYVIAGMVVGNLAYGAAHRRWFRWPADSCDGG